MNSLRRWSYLPPSRRDGVIVTLRDDAECFRGLARYATDAIERAKLETAAADRDTAADALELAGTMAKPEAAIRHG